MPVPSPRRNFSSNTTTPPPSPRSRSNDSGRETTARRVGRLAMRAIGGLAHFFSRSLRSLTSWVFSFLGRNRPGNGAASPRSSGVLPVDGRDNGQTSPIGFSGEAENSQNDISRSQSSLNNDADVLADDTTPQHLQERLIPRVESAVQPFLTLSTPQEGPSSFRENSTSPHSHMQVSPPGVGEKAAVEIEHSTSLLSAQQSNLFNLEDPISEASRANSGGNRELSTRSSGDTPLDSAPTQRDRHELSERPAESPHRAESIRSHSPRPRRSASSPAQLESNLFDIDDHISELSRANLGDNRELSPRSSGDTPFNSAPTERDRQELAERPAESPHRAKSVRSHSPPPIFSSGSNAHEEYQDAAGGLWEETDAQREPTQDSIDLNTTFEPAVIHSASSNNNESQESTSLPQTPQQGQMGFQALPIAISQSERSNAQSDGDQSSAFSSETDTDEDYQEAFNYLPWEEPISTQQASDQELVGTIFPGDSAEQLSQPQSSLTNSEREVQKLEDELSELAPLSTISPPELSAPSEQIEQSPIAVSESTAERFSLDLDDLHQGDGDISPSVPSTQLNPSDAGTSTVQPVLTAIATSASSDRSEEIGASQLGQQSPTNSGAEIISIESPLSEQVADDFYQVSPSHLPTRALMPEVYVSTVAESISRLLRDSVALKILQNSFRTSDDLKDQFPIISELFNRQNLDEDEKDNLKILGAFVNEVRKGLKWHDDLIREDFEKLNYFVFSGLQLLPFAKHMLENQFQIANDVTFSTHLEHTAKLIGEKTLVGKLRSNFSRTLTVVGNKFLSKANWMDSALYNPPFLAGTMLFQTKAKPDEHSSCVQLRHASPTYEWPYQITISPEYKQFVSDAEGQSKRILYSNHQGEGNDELRRLNALKDFEKLNKNFFLISLPVLRAVEDESIGDISSFCNYLKRLFTDPVLRNKYGFYLSKNPICKFRNDEPVEKAISDEFINSRVQIWIDFLKENLIRENEIIFDIENLSNHRKITEESRIQKNRVMYLTLLQSLLRRDIIEHCEISFCNNTCKDAIDRGAIHLFYDIYWSMLMGNRENDQRELQYLNILTFFPAYFAKEQAVLPNRLNIIFAFAKKIETLDEEAKTNLRAAYNASSLTTGAQFLFAIGDEIISGVSSYNWRTKDEQKGRLDKNRSKIFQKNWSEFFTDLKRNENGGEITFFGHNFSALFLENREEVENFRYEDVANFNCQNLKQNPVATIFFRTLNPLRQAGEILTNCSDEQFNIGLSWMAHMFTQAPGSIAAGLVNALASQFSPGLSFANSNKGHLRRWELNWTDSDSYESFTFKFVVPYNTFNTMSTDLASVPSGFVKLKAKIDTRNFFLDSMGPKTSFKWTIEKGGDNIL